MFDRFKKSRPSDEPKPEGGARETPRGSEASTSGFGRRQTPSGGAPADDMPPPSAAAPSTGFGKRPVAPKTAEPNAGAASAAMPGDAPNAEIKNDVSKEIVDWLMVELRDGRGVHCETMLTVLGALAGFAAQQSVWAAAIEAGVTPKQAFMVMGTKTGESFYYSEAVNQLLASTKPDGFSLWGFVASLAQRGGAKQLPDPLIYFKHTSGVIGSDQFGVPRMPQGHMPRLMPREALNRYWPKARSLMENVKTELWPVVLTMAISRAMMMMKDACALDFACHIVMEAAVPMSKIDPATVPKTPTRH